VEFQKLIRTITHGIVAPSRARQAGSTLIEVLVAIFVMAIGLLAVLTVFPLGALSMAQEIKDDRTAAVASEATALSALGEGLVSRTADFVEDSVSNGLVNPETAAHLREEYEHFQLRAADIEVQLEELQSVFPPQQIQRHLGPLLAQIRAIKLRVEPVIRILCLVELAARD
jgi:prepilin-type N-terminal cleavage/methylation domain-containing protein